MVPQDNLELAALNKARKYCAYKERCQSEVRNMLYEKGVHRDYIEGIISSLIVDDYLNELRFAQLYAGGKFRMKRWGRIKIKQKLFEKKISERCVREGMKEINENDYADTLTRLVEARWKNLKNIDVKDKASMLRYLQSKGYESDLIYKEMKRYSK